jgi:O-antigen ligase
MVAVVALVSLRKQHWLACAAVLAFFVIIFTPYLNNERNASFFSDDAKNSAGVDITKFGGSGRVGMWKDAARIIEDHPLLGTGLNTYTVVIRQYSDNQQVYAHNSYLQMTAELGAVGTLIFLWFLVSLGLFVRRSIGGMGDDVCAALVCGLWAGWIGYLVQMGVDTTLYSVQLSRLLWLSMGILLAGAVVLSQNTTKPSLGQKHT